MTKKELYKIEQIILSRWSMNSVTFSKNEHSHHIYMNAEGSPTGIYYYIRFKLPIEKVPNLIQFGKAYHINVFHGIWKNISYKEHMKIVCELLTYFRI